MEDDLNNIELEYSSELDSDFVDSKKEKNVVITPFMEHEWVGLKRVGKMQCLIMKQRLIKKI